MFCTTCGKEIINTARFCNYCGNPVHNIAPAPAPAPVQAPEQPYSVPAPETIPQSQLDAPQSVPADISAVSAVSTVSAVSDELTQPMAAADTAAEAPADTASEISETPISELTDRGETASEPTYSEAETVSPEGSREIPQTGAFANAAQPSVTGGVNEPFSMPNVPPQYPTPGNIPKSGYSVPGYPSPSAPVMQEKPKRERKYTLGHIMLCLAAVAIMAITAGVFAGLYFSVV